jgi:hypothetical protein
LGPAESALQSGDFCPTNWGKPGALFDKIARKIFLLVSISYPVNDSPGKIPGTDEQTSLFFVLFGPMNRGIWTFKLKVTILRAREALPSLRKTNFKAFRVPGA